MVSFSLMTFLTLLESSFGGFASVLALISSFPGVSVAIVDLPFPS